MGKEAGKSSSRPNSSASLAGLPSRTTAPAATRLKTAVFAGGCFWSMEKAFEAMPGVVDAVSGYAGGIRAPVIGFYGGKDTGIPQSSVTKMRTALSVDGKVYGQPFYGESSFLMYRKDVLAAKGITMPANPIIIPVNCRARSGAPSGNSVSIATIQKGLVATSTAVSPLDR